MTAEGSQRGSAVLEFTFLGTLLLVPVVYLILTVASLQAGSYASVGAAGQAAKVFAAASSAEEGRLAAERAALLAATDHGFDASAVQMRISCTSGQCLEAGSTVTVQVSIDVPLPLIPSMAGIDLSAAEVSASSTEVVERFG